MPSPAATTGPPFWKLPVAALLEQLAAAPDGLSSGEAALRLTRPFKSRPTPWLVACSLTVVLVAVLLPFTPFGVHLGFVAPPAFFFLILVAMLLAYLLAVEGMKRWFFHRLRNNAASEKKFS